MRHIVKNACSKWVSLKSFILQLTKKNLPDPVSIHRSDCATKTVRMHLRSTAAQREAKKGAEAALSKNENVVVELIEENLSLRQMMKAVNRTSVLEQPLAAFLKLTCLFCIKHRAGKSRDHT